MMMMQLIKKQGTYSIVIMVVLMLSLHLKGFAQEQLMPLNANYQQIQAPSRSAMAYKTASVTPMDTLPFFDDFSYSTNSTYPTVSHWMDSSVFVNHGYGIAPPSIGVATFDGLNKKGYPYNIGAPVNSSGRADILTSRPINMQKKGNVVYQPSDSVYLSFYYQAEGHGDSPEANDSLVLEFFKPNQNTWKNVWSHKGYAPASSDTLFHMVMLAIKDTAYFDSLFQFRFRNYATLSGSLDHWHIDYVFLDKNRSYVDTLIEDDTFEYMSTPFLKNYSAMPYRQFVPSEMAPNIHNYMRNNFTSTKNTSYNYTIFNTTGAQVNFYNGGNDNILPYKPNGLHTSPQHALPPVSYTFPSPMTDSVLYTIKHVISSNPDLVRVNDTLIQKQKLSTYYAYDDGTAEVGYYNNTYGAKNAVRYTINVADTLRAMRIYFDPIKNGLAILSSTFRLMVWADGNNGPGNLIYRDSTSKPVYLQGSHNLMPSYPLTSCLLLNPGTYYFGLQQTTNQPLNIGFDKNNNHANAFYFDVGNGWVQSTIKGSIMINPVLGCTVPPTPVGIVSHQDKQNAMVLYPNPAQNTITIDAKDIDTENATVTILSAIGQAVYTDAFKSQQSIDISSLPNGIYFVYLNSSSLNVTPKKLIISR